MIDGNYKMLLFDLGGVIVDIDPSITENKFKEISNRYGHNFKGLDYRNEKVSSDLTNLFFDYEQGFINDSEFRDGIRQIGKIDVSDEEIDEIVFFDDMIENLTECKKLGMNSYHVTDSKSLEKSLTGLINN